MPSPATYRIADPRLEAQRAAIAELERALWAGGLNEALLAPYQAAYRELERLIAEDVGWAKRSVPINLNPSVGLEHASVSPSSPALLPDGEGRNPPLPQGEGLGVRVKRMDTCIASDSDCPTEEARINDSGDGHGLSAFAHRADTERLIAQREDGCHTFVIVIPVADSPRQLKNCLDSLLALCRAYGYGGQRNGRWRKVAVLLADDSNDPENIARNRAIACEIDQAGLTTHYFGLAEQIALLDRLAMPDLAAIVGRHDREAFGHKGQAMMRNIAWLKCAEMAAAMPHERLLFYTVDADQEFRVKVATLDGGREVGAVSYLHCLDEIFTRTDALILTGKVVGDPPVSPAVMAGNFLEDVIAFLNEMAVGDPQHAYRQPDASTRGSGEAAYHDMADLFGFSQRGEVYRYRCPLPGEPDNAACFADFAQRLNRFFHGEHPTRISWYRYAKALDSVEPARTVYTGNCVFRPEALAWFIPFAPLRLRMSGPTLGRMLKAAIGPRFVSANLPMLHRRTLETTGQSEFRPGVVDVEQAIDLGDEFERQFHGDVMLFSMQHLTVLGYPGKPLAEAEVNAVLANTQTEMLGKYRLGQQALLERLDRHNALLDDPGHWWNRSTQCAHAVADFRAFASNLERNFGRASPCQTRLDDPPRLDAWRARQAAAIIGFHEHRRAWKQALDRLCVPSSADS